MSTCNPNLRRCDLAGTAVEGCALIGNAILQTQIFVKITEIGYRTDYFNVTDDLGWDLVANCLPEYSASVTGEDYQFLPQSLTY
jgi:hypothetical protein